MSHVTKAIGAASCALLIAGCDPCRTGEGSLEIDTVAQMEALASCEELPNEILVQGSDIEVFELPNLKRLHGKLHFNENQKLTTVKMPALELLQHEGVARTDSGGLSVSGNALLTEISLPLLESIGSPDIPAGIGISRSPKVSKLEVPKLQRIYGPISLSSTALTSVSMPTLTGLSELSLSANPKLQTLALPGVRTIDGRLGISDNDQLTTLDLSGLRGTRGNFASVEITGNAALETLALPELEEVGLGFTVESNLGLKSIQLGGTIEKLKLLTVKDNFALTSISVPHVTEIGTLDIRTNTALTDLAFDDLARIDTGMEIRSNPKLPTCDVKALVDQVNARQGIGGNALYDHNLADSCGS